MSRWYRFMYRLGFTPWEEDTESQAAQLSSLLSHVEGEREPPFGTALDLGCGTGRFSIELAQRGWSPVGVDVVPDAIETARQRARQAGVDAEFAVGDVTELRKSGVGGGFSLILDAECFNHLNDSQRESVGREVSGVAAPLSNLLILVWRRAWRGPLPSGASRADLEHAFAGWQIVEEWPYEAPLPWPLRRIDPRWYLLSRS